VIAIVNIHLQLNSV